MGLKRVGTVQIGPFATMSCGDDLVMKVQDWFFGDSEFHLEMERWAIDNCDEIDPELGDEENKLVYTDLYNTFQEEFEKRMSAFIESQGSSTEDFAKRVEAVKEANPTGEEMQFLDMMLMIVDFGTWKGMMKEAKLGKMAGKPRP